MILRRPFMQLLGLCVVVAGCSTMPSSASASFGIHSFAASFNQAPLAGMEPGAPGPPDFQAGSRPYQFTASFALNSTTNSQGETIPDGSVKDIQFELPRGVIGNPKAVPQCPMAVFESGGDLSSNCPADTQVGMMTLDTPGKNATVPLFNLVPPPGVAAQFGAVGLTPIIVGLTLSSTAGSGMTVGLHNVSQVLPITAASITLWGVPAASSHDPFRGSCLGSNGTSSGSCPSGAPVEPFLTMPSACGEPLTTTIFVDSWESPDTRVEESARTDGAGGAPSGLSGCDRLDFDPAIAVQPESSVADTPTGLSVDVSIPYQNDPEGLAEANLKDVAIEFPVGLSINPAAAGGLAGCSPAQIALGGESRPTCPDASLVGTFEVETPILSKAVQGSIYLGESATDPFSGVVTVYLAGEGDGVELKMSGQLSALSGAGQLTLTLDDAPELPLSGLKLDIFGGPRAVIATPAVCGTFTTTTELTPYSAPESGRPATLSSSFVIDENCAGGFAPTFAGGATSPVAGQSTGFALRLARADGQQYIQGLAATLPPGLLANIDAVPQCGDAEAAAGTCPASSEVGAIAVGAGAGSDPYYLNGRVYLTGPYGGAPFGMSMVIPAAAGPFDLGTVVVRGGISVNFSTSSLTIATDPFPASLEGIPLRVKNVDLTIDRPGFMLNPTNCAAQTIGGTVESDAGAGVAVSAPFRVVGCARLPFAPKLVASAAAPASRANGAGVDLAVTYPTGVQADMRSLVVELPRDLRARLTTIQQTCLAENFNRNPASCPPGALVGVGTVRTTILPSPLTGPIYLVSGSGFLPRLVMTLQGDGVTVEFGGAFHISKTGVTSAIFDAMPDVPLSSLNINLPRGPHSALGSNTNMCAHKPVLGYVFTGYNGARVKGTTKLAILRGCTREHPTGSHNGGGGHGKG